MSVQPSVLVLSGAPEPIVLSKLVETSTRFGLPESERFIDADNDMAVGGIALFKGADISSFPILNSIFDALCAETDWELTLDWDGLDEEPDFPYKSLSRSAGAKEPVLLWLDD